jgi:hypothetical protein
VEKSEITKMPEGMSSEELDELTTDETVADDAVVSSSEAKPDEAKLAQEALDATGAESPPAGESVEDDTTTTERAEEETPKGEEKPEADPKDAVIGDFRRKLRDQELETARLQGELQARKDLQTKAEEPPPKSPLELAEAAYIEENGDLDGFAMTGSLYRQQKAFDDEQAAKKAATKEQTQTSNAGVQAENELQQGDLSVEKMGEGLDLQSVAKVGQKYLTRGDTVDIADMVQTRGYAAALKETYKRMRARTLEAGGEDAKILQNAIKNAKKGKSQTKPKKQGNTDIDALTTEGEDEVKGEAETTETHSQRLANFITGP